MLRRFEIYENGDPHSRAWDCTEYEDRTKDSGFFRGDLGHRFTKAGLIAHLRAEDSNAEILNRDSGRWIVRPYMATIKAPGFRDRQVYLGCFASIMGAVHHARAAAGGRAIAMRSSRNRFILEGGTTIIVFPA